MKQVTLETLNKTNRKREIDFNQNLIKETEAKIQIHESEMKRLKEYISRIKRDIQEARKAK